MKQQQLKKTSPDSSAEVEKKKNNSVRKLADLEIRSNSNREAASLELHKQV